MAWAVTLYSKGEVTRAGKMLIDADATQEQRMQALDVMSSWRAAHAYPMHALLMMLRRKVAEIDKKAVVVQRHKRAPSIIDKLTRLPQMELSRMQDIGGCRAIVSSVRDVELLNERIQKSSTRHKLHREYDYIKGPKDTGYRGVHLTYKYNGEKSEYKDFFVELQLRSKIQHAWATAVEIVDTFTKQALKSSRGTQDWLNFFRMAGAEFAKLERRPVGADVDGIDTNAELHRLATLLNVVTRLNAFAVSANHIVQKRDNKTDYFLLELTSDGSTIRVTQYKTSEFELATQMYLEKEKQAKTDSAYDVVLVAASSMHALQNAYPNYFADSKEFVKYIGRALSVQR
ncbi:MAG: RelA/SpoT domain-containing protein [Sulfuricella sp.]|nr:RelA/SpoT domain-containing protein [Sulfuricella sp.]